MTTTNWLALIGTLIAISTTWGQLLVRVKVAEAALKALTAAFAGSRESQGARIGGCEERIALLEGSVGDPAARKRTRHRARTGAGGVPVPQAAAPEESGEA